MSAVPLCAHSSQRPRHAVLLVPAHPRRRSRRQPGDDRPRLRPDRAEPPAGSGCEDPWVVCGALAALTERLQFLVAFRPGFTVPTLAAQQAATFQRLSGGRLRLNVVTGGDPAEQRAYGDFLDHDARYARTGEFLEVLRGCFSGVRFDFAGEHVRVAGAALLQPPDPAPPIYLGGASP